MGKFKFEKTTLETLFGSLSESYYDVAANGSHDVLQDGSIFAYAIYKYAKDGKVSLKGVEQVVTLQFAELFDELKKHYNPMQLAIIAGIQFGYVAHHLDSLEKIIEQANHNEECN